MANHKQSPEFLGGGPKFNPVGQDAGLAGGAEEPITPAARTGYWLRVAAVIAVVIALAGGLIYLNQNNWGKTTTLPSRSRPAVLPDAKDSVPADPNFK